MVSLCRDLVNILDRATHAGDPSRLPRILLLVAQNWRFEGASPAQTAARLSARMAALERDARRGAVDLGLARDIVARAFDSVDEYWWERSLMPPGCAATVRRRARDAESAARAGDLDPATELAAALRGHWSRVAELAAADRSLTEALDEVHRQLADDDLETRAPHKPRGARVSDLHPVVERFDQFFRTRSRLSREENLRLRTALAVQAEVVP